MSKLTLMILAAVIVTAAVCFIAIGFFVGSGRHFAQPQWLRRLRSVDAATWFGLFFILFGCDWARSAFYAERHHTVMTSPDIGFMTPAHGYAAAGLIIFTGLYAIVLSIRTRRRSRRDSTSGI